jgi:3-oxoacyl-[acyl-carrier-protein] synthase-3
LIADSLESNGYGCDDLKLVVPHQVNSRIIESALKKLDIEMDRVYMNLEHYGNTSAASVPIAFDEVHRAGRLNEGDLISLVAFGAGLAWGSALVRW